MTLVSVIIPTYNRASRVVRAVGSVLSQTYQDYEIIIVDDGSSDGTERAVRCLDKRISYVRHLRNRGVSAARNTGIRASCAPLIAFLDSDDHWSAQKLALQVAYFERLPHTKICQTEEIWMRQGRRINPKKRHQKPSGDIFKPSLRLCLVSPSAVMLKRSLLDEIGLFDEDLPVCEDYDLWLRIACRYPVGLIPDHLVVKEGGSDDQLSRRYSGMDRFRIKSLEKLITSGMLNERQLTEAIHELSNKCRIYGTGCVKRGRLSEGEYYLNLPDRLRKEFQPSNSSRRSSSLSE